MVDEDILKYLEGQLSEADSIAFEKQMSTDESLAKRVSSYKEMKSFAESKVPETDALIAAQKVYQKQKLKLAKTNKPKNSDTKQRPILKYLIPIAVAALVILGIFVTQNNSISDQNLYADYFNPEEIGLVSRSDNNQNLLEEAENKFNQKDYVSAEISFDKLIGQYPGQDLYQYYHAISQLSNGKIEEARTTFNLLSNKDGFRNESLYYLGLSYLKEKDKVKALDYFIKIGNQFFRYDKVQEIIKHLQ